MEYSLNFSWIHTINFLKYKFLLFCENHPLFSYPIPHARSKAFIIIFLFVMLRLLLLLLLQTSWVSAGTGVTLTCSANPPGWPPPQYRWWRDADASTQGSPQTVLATGAKYMIPSAHMGSEGRYHCQATNEMGHGEPHSVVLQVHQPPRLVAKLQPHVTRRAGSADFAVKCGAQGKPKPVARWLKVLVLQIYHARRKCPVFENS